MRYPLVRFCTSKLLMQGKKQKKIEYSASIMNNRPDLAQDPGRVDQIVDQILKYSGTNLEKPLVYWTLKGGIQDLPFDIQKISLAVSVLEERRQSLYSYNSPDEVLSKNQATLDERPIDPDDCLMDNNEEGFLFDRNDLGNGVVVYHVRDDMVGRVGMRNMINTHFGKRSNPWCLLQGDGFGKLTDYSQAYWNKYNKVEKRVAFQNGKLLAFCANDRAYQLWWDKQDNPHIDIPSHGAPTFDKEGFDQIQDPSLRQYVMCRSAAMSSDLLFDILKKNISNRSIVLAILSNRNVTSQMIGYVINNVKDFNPLMLVGITRSELAPRQFLEYLKTHKDPAVRWWATTYLQNNDKINAVDVYPILYSLQPDEIFRVKYAYKDFPSLKVIRRGMMHHYEEYITGTGVSNQQAHEWWFNLKYYDVDQLEYRSCKIQNVQWIQFRGKKFYVINKAQLARLRQQYEQRLAAADDQANAQAQQAVVSQSKFNSLFKKFMR